MPSRDRSDSPGVRFPPPLLYIAVLALGLWMGSQYPLLALLSNLAWGLGGALLAAGIALGPIWGIRTLRAAGTTVRPDRATTKLVTDGPYRFSRNPLYLALSLMYAGIAILVGSVWALVLLIPLTLFISNVVIRREEAYLLRAFGEEYARYKMHVRRWV